MILLIVAKVSAQSNTTLSQAINSAFNNRKNIQAGKIEIEIQQLKTKALYKKYGLQISGEYNYNYNPILQSSIIPVGKFIRLYHLMLPKIFSLVPPGRNQQE